MLASRRSERSTSRGSPRNGAASATTASRTGANTAYGSPPSRASIHSSVAGAFVRQRTSRGPVRAPPGSTSLSAGTPASTRTGAPRASSTSIRRAKPRAGTVWLNGRASASASRYRPSGEGRQRSKRSGAPSGSVRSDAASTYASRLRAYAAKRVSSSASRSRSACVRSPAASPAASSITGPAGGAASASAACATAACTSTRVPSGVHRNGSPSTVFSRSPGTTSSPRARRSTIPSRTAPVPISATATRRPSGLAMNVPSRRAGVEASAKYGAVAPTRWNASRAKLCSRWSALERASMRSPAKLRNGRDSSSIER